MGGHLVPMNHTCLSLSITSTEWILQNHLLGTRHCPHSHTGENLATELADMLKAWNLSVAQLSAATTDNAANIVLAMDCAENRDHGGRNMGHQLRCTPTAVQTPPQPSICILSLLQTEERSEKCSPGEIIGVLCITCLTCCPSFISQAERNAIVHSVEEELASDLATLDSGCGLTASSESDLTMGPL